MGKIGSIVAVVHTPDQFQHCLRIQLFRGQHNLQQEADLRYCQGRRLSSELQLQPDQEEMHQEGHRLPKPELFHFEKHKHGLFDQAVWLWKRKEG